MLRDYFYRRQDMTSITRHTKEGQLMNAAMKLQMKAAKSDLILRMVDSFNANSVHVTVDWRISSNSSCVCFHDCLMNSVDELFECFAWTIHDQSLLSQYYVFGGIAGHRLQRTWR